MLRTYAAETYYKAHIRGVVTVAIGQSRHLSSVAACVKDDYTFRQESGRDEQIDLISSISNTVFVADAKCILEPTDAKGIAVHCKTVLGAAEQALRKVKSLEDNLIAFVADVRRFGMRLADDFKARP